MARIRTIKPGLIWTDEATAAGAKPYWLYCMTEEGAETRGPCKVGVATDLNKRLSALQGGNYRRLSIMWAVRMCDRAIALEAESHCLMRLRPSIYHVNDDRVRLPSEWVDAAPQRALEIATDILSVTIPNGIRRVA